MASPDFLSKLTLVLLKKKNHILIGMVGFFVIGYLFFEGMPFQKKQKKPALESLLTSNDQKLFQTGLQKIKKEPDKLALFSGLAAQRLMQEEKPQEAAFFIKNTLGLLSEQFAEFAKVSNEIANYKLKKALVDGYRLKTKFSAEDKKSVLYPLTLLRISLLEKQLNQPLKEQQILQELEAFLKEEKYKDLGSIALGSAQKPTLMDYVSYRKKQIKTEN